MTGVVASDGRHHWRTALVAAVVSVVTMPLTAVWFLLVGAVLLVGSLGWAVSRDAPRLGPIGFTAIGLLVGPAVYLALAAIT